MLRENLRFVSAMVITSKHERKLTLWFCTQNERRNIKSLLNNLPISATAHTSSRKNKEEISELTLMKSTRNRKANASL